MVVGWMYGWMDNVRWVPFGKKGWWGCVINTQLLVLFTKIKLKNKNKKFTL